MNAISVIEYFYPEDTPLRRMLLKHSTQVCQKAVEILDHAPESIRTQVDRSLVIRGALLHDIGILKCDAPGILCMGREPYIAHGLIGAEMLRSLASALNTDFEPYARICERHTGAGLSAKEIREQKLPLPELDFLPESYEEKLVCLADKFFSKSGDMKEKPFTKARKSMHDRESTERFDAFCNLFEFNDGDEK